MNNNRILRLVLVAVDGRSQRKTFRFFVALVFCFQQIFSGLVPLSAYHGVEIVTVGSTPTPVKAIEDPLSGPRAVEHEPSTGDLLMEGSLSAPSASDEQEPLTPSDLTLIPNPGPAPSEEEVRTYYPDETLKSRHKTVKDGGDYYEYYPSGKKKSKLTRESGNFHYYEDSQSNRELFYIKPNGEVIERVKGSYPPSVEPRTDDLEALRQTLLHQVDDVLSALSQEIKGLEQDLADFKSRAEAIVSRFQTEVDENRSALSGILAELQSIRDHNALSDQTRMDIDAYLNEVSGFLAPPSGMFEEI